MGCALIYNALVQGRNHCDEAWADIDAELKRRYDLIPNLVAAVQGYAKHERDVLEAGEPGPRGGDGTTARPVRRPATRTSWSAACGNCWPWRKAIPT